MSIDVEEIITNDVYQKDGSMFMIETDIKLSFITG